MSFGNWQRLMFCDDKDDLVWPFVTGVNLEIEDLIEGNFSAQLRG